MNFKYSGVYDRKFTKLMGKGYKGKEARENYASFIKDLKEHWTEEREKEVFNLISKHTGLEWKEETIPVYFVSNLDVSGFSDPLTIRMDDRYVFICETLVHELVHCILCQNEEEVEQVFEHLEEVFPDEGWHTRLHILVCAVTRKVFTDAFSKEEYWEAYEVVGNFLGLRRPFEILEEIYPRLGENVLDSLSEL